MELILRDATIEDARLLFDWRNDAVTRLASHNTAELEFGSHTAWLKAALANSKRQLRIAEQNGRPVGMVRIDFEDGDCAELSWVIAPEARGKGIAKRMVQFVADETSQICAIRAEIKAGNDASAKVAEAAGMQLSRQDGGVLHFYRPASRHAG